MSYYVMLCYIMLLTLREQKQSQQLFAGHIAQSRKSLFIAFGYLRSARCLALCSDLRIILAFQKLCLLSPSVMISF
jgi:hypothetical protein